MTLKTGLEVSQGHWKFHRSIERIRHKGHSRSPFDRAHMTC